MLIFEWIVSAIRSFFAGLAKPSRPAGLPDDEPHWREAKWLKLARQNLGVLEWREGSNPQVLAYYRDAGFPEIDDDSVHWCAAFCNAILERSGISGSKSLAARDFLRWGKPVKKPYPGCIVVFWRVSPRSWQGHVGFWLGETKTGIQVIGGNQSDQVSIETYPKTQLLGYREPVGSTNSRTYKSSMLGVVAAGVGSTAILDSQTQIMGIVDVLKHLGMNVPQLIGITSILSILCFVLIVWARYEDLRDKGR